MGPYRKGLCLSIVSIAVLILLAIPAVAQMPTATILGVAKDASGGVLPNATVTITNATHRTRGTKTDSRGHYWFDDITSGDLTGKPPRLDATSSGRKISLPVIVPLEDATIDLVVRPTGQIDGTVSGALDRVVMVKIRPLCLWRPCDRGPVVSLALQPLRPRPGRRGIRSRCGRSGQLRQFP